MSRGLRSLVGVAVCCAAVLPPAIGSAAAKPVVPAGKTLVLVGQDFATDDQYVAETGRPPAGFMDYAFLDDPPARLRATLDAIGAHLGRYPGAVEQLGLGFGSAVWSTLGGSPRPPGALEVMRGAYDEQIGILAGWLNTLPAQVLLRVGYEFDLLGGQWGPAPAYRSAYRHIVDRLRAAGVDNVAYVWHSAGAFFRTLDYSGDAGLLGTLDRTGGRLDPLVEATVAVHKRSAAAAGIEPDLQPIQAFYPGDGYVDFFAVSYFGDACCFGRSSARARAVYYERTRELLAQARAMGLPTMFGEATPAYIGADSGEDSLEWLRSYFALIHEFDMRATSLIVPDWPALPGGFWGQPYWNGYWPDARVHHYPRTREAWLSELDDPRYVEGGEVAALDGSGPG